MNKNEYIFRIAELCFGVSLPEGTDVRRLLPSFRPFACETDDELIFRFRVHDVHAPLNIEGKYEPVDTSLNDMGRVRLLSSDDGYCIKISYRNDGTEYTAVTDKAFGDADAYIDMEDRYAGDVINSLLRMIFSQAIIPHKRVSVHASAVMLDGKAYLFMGKSGTGKSTHSGLWMKAFDGCGLLNDDNPVLMLKDGTVYACGTPWSGKTPCYKDIVLPVGGMVRLKQAKKNCFHVCDYANSFINLLPGCSVVKKNVYLHNVLCNSLIEMSEGVRIGVMECLPDVEAAKICKVELERE